jgi:hypothetical protein
MVNSFFEIADKSDVSLTVDRGKILDQISQVMHVGCTLLSAMLKNYQNSCLKNKKLYN